MQFERLLTYFWICLKSETLAENVTFSHERLLLYTLHESRTLIIANRSIHTAAKSRMFKKTCNDHLFDLDFVLYSLAIFVRQTNAEFRFQNHETFSTFLLFHFRFVKGNLDDQQILVVRCAVVVFSCSTFRPQNYNVITLNSIHKPISVPQEPGRIDVTATVW